MSGPVFELREDEKNPTPGDLTTRRILPRPAATLLLLDRTEGTSADAVKVLMGRRHRGHDFMPDKWVFPGGRVDRADFRTPVAADLSPAAASALAATLPPGRPSLARALGVAAIRETWEEAGLALGEPRATGGPLPDLSALEVVARAITPPYRPKRFDAVFFTADASRLHSKDRAGVSGELDEIAWFGLAKAMELDLPSVTRFILKELGARLGAPARPALYLRFIRGKHTVTPFGGPDLA